ncbi:hypothetical protein SO694_00049111 [Aureococcus anophagefferens]|uniref:Uncharacterized protein n=1 Tax=Aureococcus anophagefferens TaxID=44056 RepID=A0ABR1G804_AURAN
MVLEALAELLEMPGACGELSDDDLRVVAPRAKDNAKAPAGGARATSRDVFDGAGGDDADATRDAEREVQETCGRGLRAIAAARAATPLVRDLAGVLAPCLSPCLEPDGDWPDDLRCEAFVSAACLAVDVAAHCPPGAALPGRLRGPMLCAARPGDDVRQCGAWGLGVLAARDAGLRPEALAALAAALAAYPADGTLGSRDAASDNAPRRSSRSCPSRATPRAPRRRAPRPWTPCPSSATSRRRGAPTRRRSARSPGDAENAARPAPRADAQRRLPPPPWVRDLLARDAAPLSPTRRLRVFRRFGGDAAAAAPPRVADAAAIVDADARGGSSAPLRYPSGLVQ